MKQIDGLTEQRALLQLDIDALSTQISDRKAELSRLVAPAAHLQPGPAADPRVQLEPPSLSVTDLGGPRTAWAPESVCYEYHRRSSYSHFQRSQPSFIERQKFANGCIRFFLPTACLKRSAPLRLHGPSLLAMRRMSAISMGARLARSLLVLTI